MRVLLRVPAVGALLLAASGCAAGADATHKQIGDLERQVSRLRADVAILTDRLDLASRARQPEAAPRAPAPEQAAAMVDADKPQLAVVTLAPEDPPAPAAAVKDAAPKGPNPVLRNTMSGGVEARDGGRATLYDDGKKPGGKR